MKAGLGLGAEWGDSLTYAQVRSVASSSGTHAGAPTPPPIADRYAGSMPELPEMQALAERLDEFLDGATVTGVDALGFSSLKTVLPGPETLVGRRGRWRRPPRRST